MLRPVTVRRVADDVAHQLRTLIFSREFTPGTKLPPERDLAGRLEVHRSSLREALKRLEAEGLLEIRRAEGIYVRDFMREANLAALEAFLFSPQSKQLEIFRGIQEFRIVFQKELARLAALRRTSVELAELDAVLDLESKETDPTAFRLLDWQFALVLARAAQNVIFTLVLNSVRDLHERWGALYFSAPGTIETTRRFHRLLVRAIRRRDDRRASRIMQQLLEYSNPILLENIPKSLLPEGLV